MQSQNNLSNLSLKYVQENNFFKLTAEYTNDKLHVCLQDYTDKVGYEKCYHKQDVGKGKINNKVNLLELYMSISHSKETPHQQILKYKYGDIIMNGRFKCYKVEQNGRLTVYVYHMNPFMMDSGQKQVVYESVLLLKKNKGTKNTDKKEGNSESKRVIDQKLSDQFKSAEKKNIQLNQKIKNIERQNINLKQILKQDIKQIQQIKNQVKQSIKTQMFSYFNQEFCQYKKLLKQKRKKLKQQIRSQFVRIQNQSIRSIQQLSVKVQNVVKDIEQIKSVLKQMISQPSQTTQVMALKNQQIIKPQIQILQQKLEGHIVQQKKVIKQQSINIIQYQQVVFKQKKQEYSIDILNLQNINQYFQIRKNVIQKKEGRVSCVVFNNILSYFQQQTFRVRICYTHKSKIFFGITGCSNIYISPLYRLASSSTLSLSCKNGSIMPKGKRIIGKHSKIRTGQTVQMRVNLCEGWVKFFVGKKKTWLTVKDEKLKSTDRAYVPFVQLSDDKDKVMWITQFDRH